MKRKTVISTAAALSAGVFLALSVPLAASAHVGVTPSATAAGGSSLLTFAVPHGVEGDSTSVLTIDIPDSVISVTPTVNPNWTITTTSVPLEPAVEDQTERVSQVTYTSTGAGLDAHQRDTFVLEVQLPAGEVGDVVEFPVTQTSPTGATVVWEGDEVPSFELTASVEGGGHEHSSEGATDDHTDEDAAAASATTGSSAGASASSGSSDDVLARILGVGGLVLGAAGLVFGITARRRASE